ncbi:MAG: response regulator [Bacteroidota bacterium]
MNKEGEIIFLIDDDESVRSSLTLFLQLSGHTVESFESAEEYLSRDNHFGAGCIVLDVNLSGKSGLELQQELIHRDSHLPIIFITGYANIHMSVHTLKKGAVNYLEKPFQEEEILLSVSEALERSRKILTDGEEIVKAQHLIQKLTPKEYEVFTYLITGLLNKQIADKLHIVEHTVKIHKHSICEKFRVKSVPEIIHIAYQAGLLSSGKK